MKTLRKLAVIPALAAALSMAACSGMGRPSVSDLQDAMKVGLEKSGNPMLGQLDDDVKDKLTQCMAEKFHDSDLKDETLRKAVEAAKKGEEVAEVEPEEKKKAEEISQQAGMDCAEKFSDEIMGGMGGGANGGMDGGANGSMDGGANGGMDGGTNGGMDGGATDGSNGINLGG